MKGSNQRKRREEIQSEGHGKTMQSWELAQRVSIKVETELSRIYGKENARSRLLNLKDRNNPELWARVASGEITPERICCMTFKF